MISKGPAIVAAAALLLLLYAAPAAAEPQITAFDLEAPDVITVGDPVILTIELEADAGTELSLAPGTLPPALSLRSTPRISSEEIDATSVRVAVEIEMAAFATGEVTIPPLRLLYVEASGITGEVETAATTISVVSVLPEGQSIAPRDLKPQAEIGSASLLGPVLLAGAAFLAALLLAGVLARWMRARARTKKPGAAAAIARSEALSLEDRSRRQLDGAASLLSSKGDYVAYYSMVAAAVREYLSERYGFPAYALTCDELEQEMLDLGIDRWQVRLVSGLLRQCDAAVYARYAPAMERADADLTSAYEIVEMSRPRDRVEETSIV